ncbi:MAG TPA: spermidine synthase [Pseudoneobacillus sp.]|nr:spermidine synthase [Pseudoneobacillus sp.]
MDYTPSKLWLSERLTNKSKNKIESIGKQHKSNSIKNIQTNTGSDVNSWDKISLNSIKSKKYDELYKGKSQYQDIEVVASKDIRMYLNNQLQFSSLDERIYHEAFVHIPMSLTESHKQVLILGGGDGLALREILKYSDVKHVDLVDIDSKVLHVAKNVPEIVALNNRSLYDKRVQVHAMDALLYLKKNKKTYNLIFVDFPDPADAVLANLYTVEVFETLKHFLTEDGMIVCQSFSIDESPTLYWSIGLTMEEAGLYTKGYHTIVPTFDDWGFHLAAKKPIPDKIKSITVSHKTLPRNLSNLFHFNDEVLSYKRHAIVNRKNNLQLHEIYTREVY